MVTKRASKKNQTKTEEAIKNWRPAIPQALRFRVLLEAGFSCAFRNCEFPDVDVHHIDDWAKVREHSYENLIALCPNHHRRAGLKKIPKKALRLLKAKLRAQYGLPVTEAKKGAQWSTCQLDTSEIPNFEISLEFPQFHDVKGSFSEEFRELNTLVYSSMLSILHSHRASKYTFQQTEQSAKPYEIEKHSAHFVTYRIMRLDRKIITILFEHYQNMYLAAHPNRWTETVCYELKPFCQTDVHDCVKVTRYQWAKFIGTYCRDAIRKYRKVSARQDHFDYPIPPNSNYQTVSNCLERMSKCIPGDRHLFVFFDPYAIASYADGGYRVAIPFSKLRPYLTDNLWQDLTRKTSKIRSASVPSVQFY